MEDSIETRDREMLERMHLQFRRGPGMPRSWEELPEADKEQLRRLYRESMRRLARREEAPSDAPECHACESRLEFRSVAEVAKTIVLSKGMPKRYVRIDRTALMHTKQSMDWRSALYSTV